MNFRLKNSNVIFILKSQQLGGAESQALNLAGYLQNNLKCNVVIYTYLNLPASIQFKKLCSNKKIKQVFNVDNPLVAGSKFKYLKIRLKLVFFAFKLRKHKPDIIIPYLNGPSLIAAYCKKISGSKVTFWNNRGQEVYRNDKLEKKAVLKTTHFIVNSLEAISDLDEKFNIKKEKIHFIPNFLTISSDEKTPAKLVQKKELVIGMLAHFRDEKLQILLLESFLELSKKHEFIKLHLVGNAIDKQRLNKAIEYVNVNKIQDKVCFIHEASAKSTVPYFDIGVLVSKKEGMSNSLMEYMYYKLPIVCTNHSSSKYLLGEKNKFLINNDKNELVKKLETLILNKKIRDIEAKKNFEKITNDFSVDEYVNKLEKVINS